MAGLDEILNPSRIAPDMYRFPLIPDERTRTFGGQMASQALMAGIRTVDPEYRVHSVHAYFLRPGNPLEASDFKVDRLRDGRTFSTRRIDGHQGGKATFTMLASFHRGDDGFSHQAPMPPVPSPDEIFPLDGAERVDERNSDWDRRWVARASGESTRQQFWIRHRIPLSDDPAIHACGLTYMSDMELLNSSLLPHPHRNIQDASLDHSLWFFRDHRADEWVLYDQISPSSESGRALTLGRFFDTKGRLIAAVAQEALVRFV